MQGILNNVAALWGFLLLASVLVVLLWFFYRVLLRKVLRMRRIAVIRSKRELREAVERGVSRDPS